MNHQPPTPEELATAFKALGDPTRLRILAFLRSCSRPVAVDETGDVRPVAGPTVGEVCCQITGLGRVTSTISFHLKELRQAGLITMERHGRNIACRVNHAALDELSTFLAQPRPRSSKENCECLND